MPRCHSRQWAPIMVGRLADSHSMDWLLSLLSYNWRPKIGRPPRPNGSATAAAAAFSTHSYDTASATIDVRGRGSINVRAKHLSTRVQTISHYISQMRYLLFSTRHWTWCSLTADKNCCETSKKLYNAKSRKCFSSYRLKHSRRRKMSEIQAVDSYKIQACLSCTIHCTTNHFWENNMK